MTEHIWLNGKILPAAKAVIPVLDRGVQIGFGLFEVLRSYEGRPFLLEQHVARMKSSARHFGLSLPVPFAAIDRAVRTVLKRNRIGDGYVRLVQTAGAPEGAGSFMVRAIPYTPRPRGVGVAVRLSDLRRDPRNMLYGHKTLNYLENVLTHEKAIREGFADVIHLGPSDELLEGCVTNLFIVTKGRIRTPALGSILPGVTRQVVIQLARKHRIPIREETLKPRDLVNADEAFLTNALIEVLPITNVGSRRIGDGKPGPLTMEMMRGYGSRVRRFIKG